MAGRSVRTGRYRTDRPQAGKHHQPSRSRCPGRDFAQLEEQAVWPTARHVQINSIAGVLAAGTQT